MFWPLYEEAERLNLAIALHTGFGSPTIRALVEGVPRPQPDPFPHIHPLSRGLQLVHSAFYCLVCTSLIDDFPQLRWALLETGSEWIVPEVRSISRQRKRDISQYFREGRIFASAEPHEDLPYIINALGDNCLVVASDMPHGDAFSHGQPEDEWRERGDLSEATLQKLLHDNAERLYDFTA
jgi:predicted TIM-barrel fold metal-dependent hydrolase